MSTPGRFLSRWSRLKLAPAASEPEEPAVPTPVGDVPPTAATTVEGGACEEIDQTAAPAALPDVASLALDSDFTAFLKDEVGEGLRRQALKKLFNDPHFNVMDGLDIYIDDYSVSTPIPPELLAKLRSAAEWLADGDTKDDVEARGGPASRDATPPSGEPSVSDDEALLPAAGAAGPGVCEPCEPDPVADGGDVPAAGSPEADAHTVPVIR
ncbi:MAG: DUF3306 domain-containing protein [Azoarcus sp.]|jgi:hypothetical protein|nr:DUF3306 domain-containing protein [Azoarcus sp.]MDD2873395.1 DUF3306 domain-containing protein [Azoarcus sp.]MDX9838240.1 DUF3306 domain-containing protein [Azoarcus sp.]